MLLACAVFALVALGLMAPCFIDAAVSPGYAVRGLRKRTWLFAIVLVPVAGAVAWLLAGRPRGARVRMQRRAGRARMSQRDAFLRHPSGGGGPRGDDLADVVLASWPAEQTMPIGPDDDPEFLTELDRLIRGTDA